MDFLCFCSVWCLLCLCARLFICTLWSPAGKGLTSWLSFVVSNCEFVTFPLVSPGQLWYLIGYNLDIMRPSACLVLNPITVYSYGFLFNCTTVGQATDSMTALT